ncbi:unnamed protein product [Acanthosepion pharaonis]|uniref:Uncharacterized protein n=1 Tax=Acanthosepion pharaonis TaxID=158019 RepID=A0A812DPT5_ACAPH|nr:unnamed protein product [Sepia pharaonis]
MRRIDFVNKRLSNSFHHQVNIDFISSPGQCQIQFISYLSFSIVFFFRLLTDSHLPFCTFLSLFSVSLLNVLLIFFFLCFYFFFLSFYALLFFLVFNICYFPHSFLLFLLFILLFLSFILLFSFPYFYSFSSLIFKEEIKQAKMLDFLVDAGVGNHLFCIANYRLCLPSHFLSFYHSFRCLSFFIPLITFSYSFFFSFFFLLSSLFLSFIHYFGFLFSFCLLFLSSFFLCLLSFLPYLFSLFFLS